ARRLLRTEAEHCVCVGAIFAARAVEHLRPGDACRLALAFQTELDTAVVERDDEVLAVDLNLAVNGLGEFHAKILLMTLIEHPARPNRSVNEIVWRRRALCNRPRFVATA